MYKKSPKVKARLCGTEISALIFKNYYNTLLVLSHGRKIVKSAFQDPPAALDPFDLEKYT